MKPHVLAAVSFAAVLLLASAWGDGGRLGATAAPAHAQDATGQIAFVSDRDGNNDIYVMDADGSDQTNLTNSPVFDLDPAWSPDGSRIAFSSDGEIFVMNADGSDQTPITDLSAPSPCPGPPPALTCTTLSDIQPDWSPDGDRIAFVSLQGIGQGEILDFHSLYVMNADGSGGVQTIFGIPSRDVKIGGPAWSPDGSGIAAYTYLQGAGSTGFNSPAIIVWNADGSGPAPELIGQSTEASAPPDAFPTWSPDGSRIAFQSGRDDPNRPGCLPLRCNGEIYVMNADGSDQTNLTNNPANDTEPAWSPQAIAEATPTPEPAEPTPEPVEPTPAPVESTPTPIAATGDGDGAPVGAIVGGVVGGMLLLAVGGGVGYWFLRIRKT